MNIKYWTGFSKRKNSTKVPTSGTDATVNLKDDCSILNPVFDCVGVPANVNYIYVSDFGRYYYVSDVVHVTKDRIQIHCDVDPLASFKSNIAGTTAYVEYAASSSIKTITDPRNKMMTEVLSKFNTIGTLNTFDLSASCYVVGVASNDGVEYYMMSKAKFETMMGKCFDQTLVGQLANSFYDLKNIILSACVMPRWPLTGDKSITIGDPNSFSIQLVANVHRITDTDRSVTIFEDTVDIYYPSDDLSISGQNYLDASPYTSGVLYLPFVGCVDLPVDTLASQKSIYVKCVLDQMTGDIVYKIGMDSSKILATYSGSCAANIPVCGSSYNAVGAISGVTTAIGGAVATVAAIATEGSSAAVMGGLGSIAGGAAATYSSLSHHTQSGGSLSSFVGAQLGLSIVAVVTTRKPSETTLDTWKAILGMPYYKTATISSLSGYIKCSGASVSMAGYDSEKDAINGYLNGGFYYE